MCFYVCSPSFVSRNARRRWTSYERSQPDCCFAVCRHRRQQTTSPLIVAARDSRRLPCDGLQLIRQPWRTVSCHIKVSPGFLRGHLTTSTRHTSFTRPVESNRPRQEKGLTVHHNPKPAACQPDAQPTTGAVPPPYRASHMSSRPFVEYPEAVLPESPAARQPCRPAPKPNRPSQAAQAKPPQSPVTKKAQ